MDKNIKTQEKKYKPSKYNFFFDAEDGTHLAFNAISGGFAKILDNNYEVIKKMLQKPNEYKPKTENEKDLWNNLVKGQFLVEEEIDELDVLKMRNRIARFDTSTSLVLTLTPTLACNFQCKYCYANKRDTKMSEIVQSSLIQLVEKRSELIRHLNITWLGGEPLLALNIIEFLSDRFLTICNTKGISYFAGIITNGYLLTQDIFLRLVKLKVRFFQITLDGPRSIHDTRRVLKNGNGTFDKIVSNLHDIMKVVDHNVTIAIRVNIDKMNSERAEELIDVLANEGLDDKILIGPALVDAVTPSCREIVDLCIPPLRIL